MDVIVADGKIENVALGAWSGPMYEEEWKQVGLARPLNGVGPHEPDAEPYVPSAAPTVELTEAFKHRPLSTIDEAASDSAALFLAGNQLGDEVIDRIEVSFDHEKNHFDVTGYLGCNFTELLPEGDDVEDFLDKRYNHINAWVSREYDGAQVTTEDSWDSREVSFHTTLPPKAIVSDLTAALRRNTAFLKVDSDLYCGDQSTMYSSEFGKALRAELHARDGLNDASDTEPTNPHQESRLSVRVQTVVEGASSTTSSLDVGPYL